MAEKHLEDTVKLLDFIKTNPESTQRDFVEKLDISLGKVNFLIKALTEEGIIKIERFKNSKRKAAYLYLLTPKGIYEKTRITKKFLKDRLNEYENIKNQIKWLKDIYLLDNLKCTVGGQVKDPESTIKGD